MRTEAAEKITRAEVLARPTPHLIWTLLIASIAYCLVVLDYTVVVTALPSAQRELHVGLQTLQWTVNSYGITFAAGILIAAALGTAGGAGACSRWDSPFSRRHRLRAPWHPGLGS